MAARSRQLAPHNTYSATGLSDILRRNLGVLQQWKLLREFTAEELINEIERLGLQDYCQHHRQHTIELLYTNGRNLGL